MKKQVIYFLFVFLFTTHVFGQFSFIHISDLHVADESSIVNDCDLNGAKFNLLKNFFITLNPKPSFVMVSGDVTNIGNVAPAGMYPAITQHLFHGTINEPEVGSYFIDTEKTIPIYFVPGNHDYYTTLLPPASNEVMGYYPTYLSPDTDYVITRNNAVIIGMRSGYDENRPFLQDYNITNPEGSGLTKSQCAWLRNVLAANSDKRKIIVMHHPIVDVNGTIANGTPYTGTILDTADGAILNNRSTFLNICDSNHVDAVFSGHVHQNVVANRAGNIVGETGGTNKTRYVQTGAAFEGVFRIITVNATSVDISVPQFLIETSITKEEEGISVLVYPNPVNNYMQIDIPTQSMIQIYNLEGKILKEINTTENHLVVDVTAFLKGVYFVKVISEDGVAVKKIIKQ